jgi:CHAT domain-containing protein
VQQQRSGARASDNAPFAALLGNLLNGVKVSRLLVLPDGPLKGLPFAALPMPHGHARELLIDRLVVSAAPSLALAMHSAGKAPVPQTRIAVISDPIATHAVARRDAPEQSALFLKEYAEDGKPLANDRLTVDDMARSGLRADVVVLSGCATGDGRELRGEGVIGLAYEFLANGSHTVVASLWPVEDALTARFMEEFDAAYRSSRSAPQALRIAQLRARGTSGPAVCSSVVVRANEMPQRRDAAS